MNHVDLWGRTFMLEGITSAKALGQEHEAWGWGPVLDFH